MKMDYYKNVKLALRLGFEEIHDIKAYREKYYIKDGRIWIHDIKALKIRLNIGEDEDLRRLNYDVESYYKYVNYTNEMVDKELILIKAAIDSSDSVLSGRHSLLNDKEVLTGMRGLSEEGLDEEILADFAHQMSKK
jgi:hypothetical protein